MVKEYRKIFDVHPITMYKEHILELVRMLVKCNENERYGLKVQFEYEGCHETLTSLEEIKSFSKDKSTDKLSIEIKIWNEAKEIINGISISFHFNHINYQIHSIDEKWFLGTIQQLSKFFKEHRPWYSLFNKLMPFLMPVLVITGLNIAADTFKNAHYFLSASTLVFSIICFIVGLFTFNQKLFPYVRISTGERANKFLSNELISLIITFLSLIVSVISGILIPVLTTKH